MSIHLKRMEYKVNLNELNRIRKKIEDIEAEAIKKTKYFGRGFEKNIR